MEKYQPFTHSIIVSYSEIKTYTLHKHNSWSYYNGGTSQNYFLYKMISQMLASQIVMVKRNKEKIIVSRWSITFSQRCQIEKTQLSFLPFNLNWNSRVQNLYTKMGIIYYTGNVIARVGFFFFFLWWCISKNYSSKFQLLNEAQRIHYLTMSTLQVLLLSYTKSINGIKCRY